ncbi:MAG TPA: efflux RND transporter periplasmic adaptor subunit [Steroidobacteraceae bacterium]|jgi:membrane fusion protein (multidrug efflux system)
MDDVTKPAPATQTGGIMQRRRGRWLVFATVGFLVIALVATGYWFFYSRYYQDTDDAYVAGDLVTVMPQVAGTVISIAADETDFVQAGQELVRLDDSDTTIALRESEAQLARSVRQVHTVFANRDQLEAVVAQRRSDLNKAQQDVDRRKSLVESGAVSIEELAHVRDALSGARDALTAAQKNLAASLALLGQTAVADNPEVQASAAAVKRAYLAQKRTSIRAPVTGYVARRTVQLGERIAPGTALLSIVPLERVRVDANFKEVQLTNMRIGQHAHVIADMYGGHVEFDGRIEGLGMGTGAAFALLPAQNATGNWIKVVQRVPVRIALDPKQLEQHPLRIGLSTRVQVDVRDEAGEQLVRTPRAKPVLETDVYAVDQREIDATIARIIADNEAKSPQAAGAPRGAQPGAAPEVGAQPGARAGASPAAASAKRHRKAKVG